MPYVVLAALTLAVCVLHALGLHRLAQAASWDLAGRISTTEAGTGPAGRCQRSGGDCEVLHELTSLWLQGQSKVELDLPDAFHRLLTHGLAHFHGLQSRSCLKEDQRLLQVR